MKKMNKQICDSCIRIQYPGDLLETLDLSQFSTVAQVIERWLTKNSL